MSEEITIDMKLQWAIEKIAARNKHILKLAEENSKLREKLLAQPEQKQEPVEECTNSDTWNCKYCNKTNSCKALKDSRNFAPPKREPVGDEEVRAKYRDIALDNPLYVPSYYAGFRDAERAHGIGGGEC